MIGDNIAKYRKEAKITQDELSKFVGLKQTLISRIERNKRKVNSKEVVLFAKAFKIPVEKLLED